MFSASENRFSEIRLIAAWISSAKSLTSAEAPASTESVSALLKEHSLRAKQYLALNISAGNDTRFWGIARYRSLVETIGRELPEVPVLVLFKDSDTERATEIAAGFGKVVLLPRLSFDQFAAAISQAGLLVTPDTAAVHLAAAFRVPSVVMFVQSDKKWRIWDAYKSPTENLVTDVDDLGRIPVAEVWNALRKLWERRS